MLLLFCVMAVLWGQVESGGQAMHTESEEYARRLLEAPMRQYHGVPSHLHAISGLDIGLVRKRLEEASFEKDNERAAVKYMIAACVKAEVMDRGRKGRDAELGDAKRMALATLLDAYALVPESTGDKRLRRAIESAIGRWLTVSNNEWMTEELGHRTQDVYLASLPLPSSLEDAAILLEQYRGAKREDVLRKRVDGIMVGMESFDATLSAMCLSFAVDSPAKALPCAERIMAQYRQEALDRYPCILDVARVFVKAAPERVDGLFGELAAKTNGLYVRLYEAASAVHAKSGKAADDSLLLPPVLKRMEDGLQANDGDERTSKLQARHLKFACDLRGSGEFDASIAVCDLACGNDAERKSREHWNFVNCKASCLEKKGKLSEARECYGECLKSGDSSADAKRTAERAIRRIENMERQGIVPRGPSSPGRRGPGRNARQINEN